VIARGRTPLSVLSSMMSWNPPKPTSSAVAVLSHQHSRCHRPCNTLQYKAYILRSHMCPMSGSYIPISGHASTAPHPTLSPQVRGANDSKRTAIQPAGSSLKILYRHFLPRALLVNSVASEVCHIFPVDCCETLTSQLPGIDFTPAIHQRRTYDSPRWTTKKRTTNIDQ
jgi:hypothetical protein